MFFWSLTAAAQTSATSVSAPTSASDGSKGEVRTKIEEVLTNKKYEENAEITDAKMRADAGSLSRYSMRFSLGYYGPPIGELDQRKQPNPDGSVGNSDTAISGSVNAVYRFSSNSTLSMGTGIKALTPFHGLQRFDTSDPYLSYGLTDKLGAVQMRNSFGVSAVTQYNYRQVGEYAGLNWDSSYVYALGTSKFSVGTDTSLGYYLYNRSYIPKDGKAVQYSLSMYPMVKYTFNDKLSMNTSVAVSWWNLRRRENPWLLENRTLSQRLAVGWAIRRDIYLQPYLNFYPEHLAMDSTTFNISGVFSVL